MSHSTATAIPAPFVVRGRPVWPGSESGGIISGRFRTPDLDIDDVVPLRGSCPSAHLATTEIIEFLDRVGARVRPDNPIIAAAIEAAATTSELPRRVLENCYRRIAGYFSRDALEAQVEHAVGRNALDGWRPVAAPGGRVHQVKAAAPRILHIMAGNAPMVAATTITSSALVRGFHVLKLPSNDLFSAPALLRIMAEVDPEHPVLASFTAVYWRGGDETVENSLIRPQYFDKLAVWGGAPAIKNVTKNLGPGLELIAFDPKSSISLIGSEAFASADALRAAARGAAVDVTAFQQEACASSRIQFVEGTVADVDRFCAALIGELGIERELADSGGQPPGTELREQVDVLRLLDPDYRVWGDYDGRGLVIRSPEPVSFDLGRRTVNVVPVERLVDAIPHVNVSTSTVGIFPVERKAQLRDALAAAGAQRIVGAGDMTLHADGVPHDGLYVLSRFVRWVADLG